ncbi:hypothetical protein PENDEC_c002G03592 [Penicillium decumbens]|uniref:CCHC-type domain-containing protein n=1 Tax=Penicillium decumbens TaxID=69771 RepID=A0A1V6PLU6_PENDC|nr:hypothetical protein PENDEC_c002G03592 [Penicillium decumbens]
MALSLNLYYKQKETRRAPATATAGSGTNSTPAAAGRGRTGSASPFIKREGTAAYKPIAAERTPHLKEGRCFKCHKQGHTSRECPKKPTAVASIGTATKLVESPVTTPESGNA